MVRLSIWKKSCLMIPVILGIYSGISFSIYLLFLALILLLVIITLISELKYNEYPFLFALSFFTCFPFDMRVAAYYFELIAEDSLIGLHVISMTVLAAVALISIEEIILGLIGYFLWGQYEKP